MKSCENSAVSHCRLNLGKRPPQGNRWLLILIFWQGIGIHIWSLSLRWHTYMCSTVGENPESPGSNNFSNNIPVGRSPMGGQKQQMPAITVIHNVLLFWCSENIPCHQMGSSTWLNVLLYFQKNLSANNWYLVQTFSVYIFNYKYPPDSSNFTQQPKTSNHIRKEATLLLENETSYWIFIYWLFCMPLYCWEDNLRLNLQICSLSSQLEKMRWVA